jgi:hypothetical protein
MSKKLLFLNLFFALCPSLIFAQSADYYPLKVGDFWVFNVSRGQNEVAVVDTLSNYVDGIDSLKNKNYFRIKTIGKIEKNANYKWLYKDEKGDVSMAFIGGPNSDINKSILTFDPSLEIFKNSEISLSNLSKQESKQTKTKEEIFVKSISEDVLVPAGVFNNCIKIQRTITVEATGDTHVSIEYYAQDVGVVKMIGDIGDPELQITQELIEYHIEK